MFPRLLNLCATRGIDTLLYMGVASNKPLVALCTSVVPFQTEEDPQRGYVVWDGFDKEVLGCNYQGYNPKSRATGCDIWAVDEAASHPILKGVETKFHSPCRIYRQRPLAVTTTTPDHWHALQTVRACQAGKHVYVEKPASRTVADGQAMTLASSTISGKAMPKRSNCQSEA
jgi:hypothetical protein